MPSTYWLLDQCLRSELKNCFEKHSWTSFTYCTVSRTPVQKAKFFKSLLHRYRLIGNIDNTMATPSPSDSVKGSKLRVKAKSFVHRLGGLFSGKAGGAVAGPANSSAGQLLDVPPTQQNTTSLMSVSDSHLEVVSTQSINMVRPGTSSSLIQCPPTTEHSTTSPASQLTGSSITPISPCTLINR